MREPNGYVTFNDRPPSHSFLQYVNTQVRDWIRTHDSGEDTSPEYEVAFFDEDSLGEISCLVTVNLGEHSWRSWMTADSAQTALKKSLTHLAESEVTTTSV